jgi:hypothetical protein
VGGAAYTSIVTEVTCEECRNTDIFKEDEMRLHIVFNGDVRAFGLAVISSRLRNDWNGSSDDPSR